MNTHLSNKRAGLNKLEGLAEFGLDVYLTESREKIVFFQIFERERLVISSRSLLSQLVILWIVTIRMTKNHTRNNNPKNLICVVGNLFLAFSEPCN